VRWTAPHRSSDIEGLLIVTVAYYKWSRFRPGAGGYASQEFATSIRVQEVKN